MRDDIEVDSKDMYGATPLSAAVQMGQDAVVRLLRQGRRQALSLGSSHEY